ncbi:MAG: acylphosphatase [Pelagibacteraceae bacterium]|nr:acylphosphatase [Pelagibacteraceae bacterium]MBO6492067.1 acylphosphatase [Pelagibacteraceae bacterium]
MKRIHIIITGTVTGVGFRWWLKMEAEKRNIHGFVKNRTEYEVEALLLGHEKDVEDVVRLCRKGPSSSKVESIKIEDYQQEYTEKSFDIL